MAAAHPFVAFVSCRFKRIGCVRTIKFNNVENTEKINTNKQVVKKFWETVCK